MSFWSKAKGVFSRIGQGIKTVAKKGYNVVKGVVDKFAPVIGGVVSTAISGNPMIGYQAGKAVQGVSSLLPYADG